METWPVPIYHTSDGSASRLPYAGLCSGSNAELSRNRCSACGRPRHEVMLGHDSFANSTNDQRNFVGVSLSVDSAWLLVERQHTTSPHLFSGKAMSALSVCLSRGVSCFTSPHVFCSAQTMMGCILPPTQSVTLCSKVLSLQDEHKTIWKTSLFPSVSVMSQWCPVALTCWCFSQGPLRS